MNNEIIQLAHHFISNPEIWSVFTYKNCYVLPYYGIEKKDNYLLKCINRIFERLGEQYQIKEVYNNSIRYTGVEINEADFNETKLDYLETELKRLIKISKKEPKKKIIIEI